MPIPNVGGGRQDGPLSTDVRLVGMLVPTTATATATLTVAQLTSGMLLGSPGATAATYTLPTVALLNDSLVNALVGHSFDLNVINVNGSGTGVITLATATGWTLVGLMTVVATAGTAQLFRAHKTGEATWTLYRLG